MIKYKEMDEHIENEKRKGRGRILNLILDLTGSQ